MSTNTNEESVQELKLEAMRIEEDADYSGSGHLEAACIWNRVHFGVGVPNTIFAVAAGVLAAKGQIDIAVACSIIAAILAGLITFIGPKDRADRHSRVGNAYKALRNDGRVFHNIRTKESHSKSELSRILDELVARRTALNIESPVIPEIAYRRAKKLIEAGSTSYKVDRAPEDVG